MELLASHQLYLSSTVEKSDIWKIFKIYQLINTRKILTKHSEFNENLLVQKTTLHQIGHI